MHLTRFALEELSARLGIPVTSIKLCLKAFTGFRLRLYP